jgi:hypothetical protein
VTSSSQLATSWTQVGRGSPQLNSFGPNFLLADELLEAGAPSVLEFLDLCRSFWSYGAKALDAWQVQIRVGQRPDFRDPWKYILSAPHKRGAHS